MVRDAVGMAEQARENRAYLRRLLSERQPDFLAALQSAEHQTDLELSGQSSGMRGMMIMTALYHRDGSACADRWSCPQDDHTTVPPRCGADAGGRLASCELPVGHPGPHVRAA